MKKYIAYITSILAVIMSSCSNEDIIILKNTTFKIDPSHVVSSFTYEINAGDLEGLPSGDQLRVRLLIYNSKGILVESETQFLSSYASLMTTSLDLAEGNYTAVVVTDVVEKSGNEITFANWELSGENDISTTKITDLGFIGGRSKILGIGSKEISVPDSGKEFLIKPSPVGAVFCVMYKNIHTYSDIPRLTLETNRSSDYLILNKDGSYEIAVENNNNKYDWRICYIEPDDFPNSTNVCGYYFVFPINNNSFRFRINIENADPIYTDPMPFNIKAGSEYYFELNLCDPNFDGGISYGGSDVTNKTRGTMNQNTVFDRIGATLVNQDKCSLSWFNK